MRIPKELKKVMKILDKAEKDKDLMAGLNAGDSTSESKLLKMLGNKVNVIY